MNYRHLGRTGIRVSELSFGSWVTFKNQVDVKAAVEIMSAAYDAGVNFFDNAEVYASGKSEEVMGEALKKLKWRRGNFKSKGYKDKKQGEEHGGFGSVQRPRGDAVGRIPDRQQCAELRSYSWQVGLARQAEDPGNPIDKEAGAQCAQD